ncbi:MAG: helix-turn-helix transcriptional regulator [Gemmatimonadetes bacterium]|nr:AraC family transcriptional regulator [Gemmatimonadota bacterium]NNM07401.1 helix-turn-helix transcriptional regulator [Gemmatimonadota bacterium]
MDDILVLPSDQRAAAALNGALEPPYRVGSVAGIEDLVASIKMREPQACILDIFDPPPPIPLSSLGSLKRNHPNVALVIASDFSEREMDLYHLGRLSVDGVIRMENRPNARDVLAVVDRAIAASLATRVIRESAVRISPLGQEAIRWAIEHAEHTPQASDLAAAMAMSPRSFMREMKAVGLGSPRALLLWGRLIRASHLLERSAETVESVAFKLGYSSGGALGKALKRHVGCSPTELLDQGGVMRTMEVLGRTITHVETEPSRH